VVAAFFAIAAWKQHNAIERLGSLIIVAGALFIIYYIRRHGAEPPDPNPDQTLGGYQRALAEKYGHQIRLLRNVKFWYLAPMYVGLLIATAGLLKERAASGALTWVDAIGPIVYTLVFAAIWWLNEVYTVRKLQGMRTKLMAGEEEQETPC
jgi:vacuolar-type H+-ATPase subunit I/STV1